MQFEKMFTTIDAHVSGEAFRVIVHSPFQLLNESISTDELAVNSHLRQAKQLLLNEPRGHRGINGCIILPSSKCDFAVQFLHHEHQEHVSYSGLIATLTVLLETGQIPIKKDGQYTVETSKGIYNLPADVKDQVVQNVQVTIGSCHILETTDEMHTVEVDKTRRYFLYPLPESIPTLDPKHLSSIMKWGEKTAETHRDELFNGIILKENITSDTVRSVTFETDGVILRSPGFDSSCAIFTECLSEDKNIFQLKNQSIFESNLTASVNDHSEGSFTITAQAFIIGEHRFLFDPDDPLKNGFLMK